MDLRSSFNTDAVRGVLRGENRSRVLGGSAALLLVLCVVLALVVTSCGGDRSAAGDASPGGGKPTGPSRAEVTVTPRDGAKEVATTDALKVTAAHGKLTEVTVKDAKGERIPGEVVDGGRKWQPDRHLRTDADYTVDTRAEDAEGRTTDKQTEFTTMTPDDTFISRYTPEDGDKVGVGMPVSLRFDQPITDRRSVEKAVRVSADPEVDVRGHWFGDQRLDFRPEKYWKAGTEVTLELNLDGVEGAEGVYGEQNKTVRFEVGRSQVSVVDVAEKQMEVTRDGEKVKTIPISAGASGTETYNGKMVVSEKHEKTRMNGETVGFGDDYDIKDVPHAMRLSTSGTFIHGNYWAGKPTFGSANTSHGCIGLFDLRGGGDNDTPGAWFFNHSMVGDVVEVKNAKDETIAPDNGYNGWNMDWKKWTAEQN